MKVGQRMSGSPTGDPKGASSSTQTWIRRHSDEKSSFFNWRCCRAADALQYVGGRGARCRQERDGERARQRAAVYRLAPRGGAGWRVGVHEGELRQPRRRDPAEIPRADRARGRGADPLRVLRLRAHGVRQGQRRDRRRGPGSHRVWRRGPLVEHDPQRQPVRSGPVASRDRRHPRARGRGAREDQLNRGLVAWGRDIGDLIAGAQSLDPLRVLLVTPRLDRGVQTGCPGHPPGALRYGSPPTGWVNSDTEPFIRLPVTLGGRHARTDLQKKLYESRGGWRPEVGRSKGNRSLRRFLACQSTVQPLERRRG